MIKINFHLGKVFLVMKIWKPLYLKEISIQRVKLHKEWLNLRKTDSMINVFVLYN